MEKISIMATEFVNDLNTVELDAWTRQTFVAHACHVLDSYSEIVDLIDAVDQLVTLRRKAIRRAVKLAVAA